MRDAILSFFGTNPSLAWALVFATCAVIAAIAIAILSLHSPPTDK